MTAQSGDDDETACLIPAVERRVVAIGEGDALAIGRPGGVFDFCAGVRKQLELASARGAARAVIIGPDERKDGLAVVRNLRAGTEAKVPLDKLLNGYFD